MLERSILLLICPKKNRSLVYQRVKQSLSFVWLLMKQDFHSLVSPVHCSNVGVVFCRLEFKPSISTFTGIIPISYIKTLKFHKVFSEIWKNIEILFGMRDLFSISYENKLIPKCPGSSIFKCWLVVQNFRYTKYF